MIINTNINAMNGINNLRQTGLGLSTQLERLSSGLRINKGADDPSGLAIAKHMEAQVSGIRTAVMNAEDGISLIHTADGVLAETHDVMMRMRDLAVRASNSATLTESDMTRLNNEIQSLMTEVSRKATVVAFNEKAMFTGEYTSGLAIQVGPDNGTNFALTIMIGSMSLGNLMLSGQATYDNAPLFIASTVPGSITIASSVSLARAAIEYINSAINIVSDTRASLGIQERRLYHIIDDLKAEDINISAAKSRIWDADMASEITEFTRLQILQQSSTAILGQANAMPQSILQLITG